MVRQKAQLVRQLGLGGGMVWALDLDDFKGHCGEGVHPLLTELQSVLAKPISDSDQRPSSAAIAQQTTSTNTTNAPIHDSDADIIEEIQEQSSSSSSFDLTGSETYSGSSDETDYKVVCYFTNWAWYVNSIVIL